MHELEKIRDRVILVGIASDQSTDASVSLAELEELAKTAGAEVLTHMIQNRDRPDPGTYLGKGKIEELKELAGMLEANGVICDDELSPAQLGNLQEMLQGNMPAVDSQAVSSILSHRVPTGTRSRTVS